MVLCPGTTDQSQEADDQVSSQEADDQVSSQSARASAADQSNLSRFDVTPQSDSLNLICISLAQAFSVPIWWHSYGRL